MSGLESTAVGVVILLLMLVFIGIWIWAWLPHHKGSFDLLARMPMLDVMGTRSTPDSDATLSTSHKRVRDEDNR